MNWKKIANVGPTIKVIMTVHGQVKGEHGVCWVGMCKPLLEPTTLTGTDPPAPPLEPIDGANVSDWNANGAPMPVR